MRAQVGPVNFVWLHHVWMGRRGEMRDSRTTGRGSATVAKYLLLAAEALARLLRARARGALNVTVLERLTQAFLEPVMRARLPIAGQLRRNRISDSDLADFYLPQSPAPLGWTGRWTGSHSPRCTMAVARMQAYLREIGTASVGAARGRRPASPCFWSCRRASCIRWGR